jgi:hypothetical protein
MRKANHLEGVVPRKLSPLAGIWPRMRFSVHGIEIERNLRRSQIIELLLPACVSISDQPLP